MINSHKMVSLEYLGEVTLLALFPRGELLQGQAARTQNAREPFGAASTSNRRAAFFFFAEVLLY